MNNESKQLGNKFLLNWVLANTIGWLVGFIGAFILSYLVVNIFYHKETNLILGMCTGASVGYAQWWVLKRKFKIRSLWGLVPTICLGIPFVIEVIWNESGYEISWFQGGYELLGRLTFGLVVGLVIGTLQMPLLQPYFKKTAWWIVVSSIGWGVCWLISSLALPLAIIGVLLGGFLLGLISGYGIIYISKTVD